MAVKKIYIVIIVLILAGIGGYMYSVAIKHSENPAQTGQNIQGNDVNTTSSVTPTRKELTKEELVAADWPMSLIPIALYQDWKRFGDFEIKFDTKVFPDVISVRKIDSQQVVATFSSNIFIPPTPERVARNERRENVSSVEIIANPQLGKLYAFFTFGNSHGGGFRKVYESDSFGHNAHELVLEQGTYTYSRSYRFSPDYTELSYFADETKYLSSTSDTGAQVGDAELYFHIIDLLDPEHSIKFLMPTIVPRIGARSDDVNWVAAWRFTDKNALEFTRYVARGNEVAGYTQISDKELWSYDRKNGKMTLLKTIPLKH